MDNQKQICIELDMYRINKSNRKGTWKQSNRFTLQVIGNLFIQESQKMRLGLYMSI